MTERQLLFIWFALRLQIKSAEDVDTFIKYGASWAVKNAIEEVKAALSDAEALAQRSHP